MNSRIDRTRRARLLALVPALVPALVAAVERTGRHFIEVRRPPAGIAVGTGEKRSGRRLLALWQHSERPSLR